MPTPHVITSLATPFWVAGSGHGMASTSIDERHLAYQLRRQADAGIKTVAVAVAGWAGEGPTLGRDERQTLVRLAVGCGGDRLKVLAHVGTSDTAKSVALGADAALAGASGLILVMPPYNKPNSAGLAAHVQAIARSTALPIYLEFDPARSNMQGSAAEMAALAGISAALPGSSTIPQMR